MIATYLLHFGGTVLDWHICIILNQTICPFSEYSLHGMAVACFCFSEVMTSLWRSWESKLSFSMCKVCALLLNCDVFYKRHASPLLKLDQLANCYSVMLFIELCFNNILQSGSWNSIEICIIYPSNVGMEISENQKKQAMQNARKSRQGKMKGEYLSIIPQHDQRLVHSTYVSFQMNNAVFLGVKCIRKWHIDQAI